MPNEEDQPSYKRTHLITWERAAKGDLQIGNDGAGYMNSAQSPNNSILAMLCIMGVADDGHVSAALTYEDWKAGYESMFVAAASRLYRQDDRGTGEGDKASDYIALTRELGSRVHRLIEEALRRHPQHLDRQAVWAIRFRYRDALDALGHAIRAIRDGEKKTLARPSETR